MILLAMNSVKFSRRVSASDMRFVIVLFGLILCFVPQCFGQTNEDPPVIKLNTGNEKKDADNPSFSELLTKQQLSRRKKEYDDMLQRGDKAAKLSEELETSIASRETLSSEDIQKLQELEKLVLKIRDDLGGDDDAKESDENSSANSEETDEIVKVDSNLVIVNATITDLQSHPVSGLLRNRFAIFEDGVQQKIEFFSSEETPFAAVVLLDSSGSMEERISMARAAAIRFLNGMRESDYAAVYRFDSKVVRIQDFSNSRDIDESVFDVRSGGMTVLNDAIVKAAEELAKRPEKRRAIVVLSDGEDTQSGRSADFALKAALRADASVYTVDMSAAEGARRFQNIGVLKTFAEKTGGRFISTPGGAQMRQAFEQIVAELGTQYTLAYETTNTAKDGKWRAIEVRVNRKDLNIRTRKGYHAPKK